MADPLAALADREVPERTNFFDPAAAQDVISRYANARRGAESSEALADSVSRAYSIESQRSRAGIDAAEERRRAMLFDRDEQDYQDRNEFKAQRGAFLDNLATLDPMADDYDASVSEIIKGLPSAALEDDAVKALLTHKNRIADSVRTEKEMQMRREEQYGYQMQGFREKEDVKSEGWKEREAIRQQSKAAYQGTVERLKNARAGLDPKRAAELADDPELAAYEAGIAQNAAKSASARERMDYASQLSGTKEERRDRMNAALDGMAPEEINAFRKDDGTPDWEAIAFNRGERKRDIAEQTAVDREGRAVGTAIDREKRAEEAKIRAEGRAEESTIRKEQRRLKDEAKRSPSEKTALKLAGDLIYDQEAFPTQMSSLRRKYPKLSDSDLKMMKPAEYGPAAEYDAEREKSEMGSALNAPTADAYIKLVEGQGGKKLTEPQRRKRQNFWEAVNSVSEVTTPAPTGSSVPAANAPETSPPTADPNQAALDWLKANPKHEKAAAVRAKLGIK